MKFDIIIIGAGILGCMSARALSRYDLNVLVLEEKQDVCTGISKANTAIIYPGYDQHPGSLKAEMTQRACREFPALCRELDVPFRKCGLLMLGFGPHSCESIQKKLKNGLAARLENLRILSGKEAMELEPKIAGEVSSALLAEEAGTVNPWELGIAAFENALANDVTFAFNKKVVNISRDGREFLVETETETFRVGCVVNAAGTESAKIHEMTGRRCVELVNDGADYIVFDQIEGLINHIISVEPETKEEGVNLIPTVDGNILLGTTRRAPGRGGNTATDSAQLRDLLMRGRKVLPELPQDGVIRCFAGIRPNPYYVDEAGNRLNKSIRDFVILEEDGLISLVGIKTPGITCAEELGRHVCRLALKHLGGAGEKSSFNPERKSVRHVCEKHGTEEPSPCVCRCRKVTRAEVVEAIRRGATTVDGIKRRTGAGMGRCQGGFCTEKIMKILAEELGMELSEITKDGPGSEIL